MFGLLILSRTSVCRVSGVCCNISMSFIINYKGEIGSVIKYDGVLVLLLALGLHWQSAASEVVLQVVFVRNTD